jgi:hypothetical protein
MPLPRNPLFRTARHEYHLPSVSSNFAHPFTFSSGRVHTHARSEQIHPRARQPRHIERMALKPQQRAIMRDSAGPKFDVVRGDRCEELEEHECSCEGEVDACHGFYFISSGCLKGVKQVGEERVNIRLH